MKNLKELLTKKLSKKTLKNFLLVLMIIIPFLSFWIGVAGANLANSFTPKKAKDLITPTVKPTRIISAQDKVLVTEKLNENTTSNYIIYQDRNALKVLPPNTSDKVITLEDTSDNFSYEAAISPDNKNIVYIKNHVYTNPTDIRDNNIYFYNIATKQKKAVNINNLSLFSTTPFLAIEDNSTIQWSPKGDYVVLVSPYNKYVYLINYNNFKDSKYFFGDFISFVDDYNFLYSAENYDYVDLIGTSAIIAQRDIRKTFNQLYKESPNSPLLVQESLKKYNINYVDQINKIIYYTSSDLNYNQNTKMYQIGFDGKNKKELDKFPDFITNKDLTDKISQVLDTNIEIFPNPSISNIFFDSKNKNLVIFECIPNVDEYSPTGTSMLLTLDQTDTSKGITVLAKDFNRVLDYSK